MLRILLVLGTPRLAIIAVMAISISFGIIFATVITLFLVPSLYMLQQDGFARRRCISSRVLNRPAQVQSD